jgi:hypothetical protein
VDTVIDGKTGIIFDEPSGESLAAGILRLEGIRWDSAALRRHAANFGMEIFQERLKKTVVSVLSERGLTDVISEIERPVAS